MARGVNGGDPPAAVVRRAHRLLNLLADSLQGDPELLERLGRYALTLVDETQQQVLGADEVVVEQTSFLLGQHHDPSGSLREPFEQVTAS